MKVLLIQTAFIGDVILASGIPERIKAKHPDASIHFLVRKGNESLLENNPSIDKVLIWNKKEGKYKNLFNLISSVRKTRYDYVICLQRFAAMGLLTACSKAKHKIGFKSTPFSFRFTKTIKHDMSRGTHEIDRNALLAQGLIDGKRCLPKLYPTQEQMSFANSINEPYSVVAPASVWATKQAPKEKFVELTNQLGRTFLIGGPDDLSLCNSIKEASSNENVEVVAGKLNLMESAGLIKKAKRIYTNDSAPMHLASAMNAPVTAIFCSTVPQFGFGPLSDDSKVCETPENLDCRPCGLHGKTSCPKGHFKCGNTLTIEP